VEQKNRRFQVINFSQTANTTANTVLTAYAVLDRAYNRVVGAAYFPISEGGVTDNYNVGLINQRKTIIDDLNINAWNANDNVAPEGKYYKLNESYAAGEQWTIRVVPNANTNTTLSGQMVLILEADLTELPMR
jgi:hypothetical protein